jgi:hypothetical protein
MVSVIRVFCDGPGWEMREGCYPAEEIAAKHERQRRDRRTFTNLIGSVKHR